MSGIVNVEFYGPYALASDKFDILSDSEFADKNGIYVDHLRAYLLSDAKGEYQFKTEWPALSVPHIHFIVSAEGYETIETQWRGNEAMEIIQFDIILRNKLLP